MSFHVLLTVDISKKWEHRREDFYEILCEYGFEKKYGLSTTFIGQIEYRRRLSEKEIVERIIGEALNRAQIKDCNYCFMVGNDEPVIHDSIDCLLKLK